MNSQMAKKMKELLNEAYTTMQNLTLQATAGNVNAIARCLNNVQTVYNLLNSMPDGMEEDDEQVHKAE